MGTPNPFGKAPKTRTVMAPEGLALISRIPPRSERLAAFLLDFFLILAADFALLTIPFYIGDFSSSLQWTIVLFLTFIVNNAYFIYFELSWQGRTPGKKLLKLRVVNRHGGELSPFSVVVRNLTRQMELLTPTLLWSDGPDNLLVNVALPIVWFFGITLLPFWNRDGLRAGDLLGGTLVISSPRAELLPDLSAPSGDRLESARRFSSRQLSIYGNFELQVLEEILRKPVSDIPRATLWTVARKIAVKIDYPLDPELTAEGLRLFLTDFYAALRAFLEEGRLYGRDKKDQNSPPASGAA
jgi:uncharacterized RDD family membrane protein YckC